MTRLLTAFALFLGALCLPASAAADTLADVLGRLSWGVDAQGQPWTAAELKARTGVPPEVLSEVDRVVQVAGEGIDKPVTPVEALHMKGTLFSDPQHKASDAAVGQLSLVYAWATCARVAQPPLSDRCGTRASDAIGAWTATYKPTGNPINENNLVPLLQSIDLMLPLLPPDRAASALAWTADLAKQGTALFATFKANDTRLINNWNSWRLLIAGLSATITADADLQASVRDQVQQQLKANINADGSTFDFTNRDALHYHVYDLEALVQLDLLTPLVDADGEAAIHHAVQFIQPYYTGQQQHVEFANTTVPFDTTRTKAGDPEFQHVAWKPSSARTVLRLAANRFPDVLAWTGPLIDESYAPRIKMTAALLGG